MLNAYCVQTERILLTPRAWRTELGTSAIAQGCTPQGGLTCSTLLILEKTTWTLYSTEAGTSNEALLRSANPKAPSPVSSSLDIVVIVMILASPVHPGSLHFMDRRRSKKRMWDANHNDLTQVTLTWRNNPG